MAIDAVREIALKALYDINEKGAYSNITLDKYLEGHELREVDRAFITELVYGTLKWKLAIDWIIGQFSSIKLKKISPWILNTLRLGVYQILYTDRIPDSAACNESVALAKRYGHEASGRYVNAVLRNVSRSKGNINYPDKQKELEKYLSVKYSHPEWMVGEWLKRFGGEFTESLLDSNNTVPDFTIRVNTLKVSKRELAKRLEALGMETAEGKFAEEAMIIKKPVSISNLDAFKEGLFQIQDESSMLVAKVLDPKPGELAIDVCSAPGGKSTHIAQLMNNIGTVLARDIHEHKIRLIEDAASRLGITIIKAELFDAAEVDDNFLEKADRVLVDAPCTGLGIIRRKPDIKWARNMGDKKEITCLQGKILNASAKYVKPGGVLVYSTCTIEKEENEDIVRAFIEKEKDFTFEDISGLLPIGLKKSSATFGYIQLYPNLDGIDGFFICRMRRRG
ncbi:MAG: 16S rRNA (cytosine(967)-C(5))-methyltransferase RsmB [Clostridia bacterium]|nr:16S rRNA (cytosine(967)-C(5))-methyltransferase RsmB [Clostridia bacterium]